MQDSHPDEVVQDLVGAYIDQINRGERVTPDDVLRDHPTIAAEILDHLETFVDLSRADDNVPLGTLGDYTLRRQIGRGGMGVVYEAWQGSMDRVVALKACQQALLRIRGPAPGSCARLKQRAS